MPAHLFTTQDYGLSNRLRGYVGAWAHAKKAGCTLDVLWTPSPACPYAITDLFDPLPGSRFITAPGTDYAHTTNDHGHLFHILHGNGLSPELAPLLIASLKPLPAIRRKLAALAPTLSGAIGFHVRRTDHTEYANTLGGPTPLEVFWTIADASAAPIFLACDDSATLAEFLARYGDRVLTAKAFAEPMGIRNTDGEHAVLDLYCLALCAQFQGSHASSFTAHAQYLRQAWIANPTLRKQALDVEKVVFAFSLYGDKRKYTEGMVANAHQISERFPNARIQIYVADDVPADTIEKLNTYANVRIVPVARAEGTQNTLNRFMAYDDPDCDILFSRDADSRVHERDAACIEDFIASDKLLHIIRDHKGHTVRIMAGMWGLRKKALGQPMTSLIHEWLASHGNPTRYGCDQAFLAQVVYHALVGCAMIHDSVGYFKDTETICPFRVPLTGKLFVGQVHGFTEAGEEMYEYDI
jgi:hypothetical protein